MVTFFSGDFDVCYKTYNLDMTYNEGGFIFQDMKTPGKDSLKLQNDQLKATVRELMDSIRKLFNDRDRLSHLVKEREQNIEKLEKKLQEMSDEPKYCETCKYYEAPHCIGALSYKPSMVSPTYTCRDWQPKENCVI